MLFCISEIFYNIHYLYKEKLFPSCFFLLNETEDQALVAKGHLTAQPQVSPLDQGPEGPLQPVRMMTAEPLLIAATTPGPITPLPQRQYRAVVQELTLKPCSAIYQLCDLEQGLHFSQM